MEAKHEIKQNIVQRLHDERTDGRTDKAILDAQVYILLYTVKCISLRRLDMKNVPGLSNILFGGHLLISYSLKFYNLTYII